MSENILSFKHGSKYTINLVSDGILEEEPKFALLELLEVDTKHVVLKKSIEYEEKRFVLTEEETAPLLGWYDYRISLDTEYRFFYRCSKIFVG